MTDLNFKLLFNRFVGVVRSAILIRNLRKLKDLKVQFGSGDNLFEGWINTDIFLKSDKRPAPSMLYVDVKKNLPFTSNSLIFAYSEHLIEHLEFYEAVKFVKELKRVIKKNGVVRLATVDLDYIAKKYLSRDWKRQDWLKWPEYKFIKTPAEMFNISMRWWGHKYLYNDEELIRLFNSCGFKQVRRSKWGRSVFAELNNLETRKDSKLIIEAIK